MIKTLGPGAQERAKKNIELPLQLGGPFFFILFLILHVYIYLQSLAHGNPHPHHQSLYNFFSTFLILPFFFNVHIKTDFFPLEAFPINSPSKVYFPFSDFFFLSFGNPGSFRPIDSGCDILYSFWTLGQKKGEEQPKLKVLRKSLYLLMEFRSADEVICLCRDYKHLILTRKKNSKF